MSQYKLGRIATAALLAAIFNPIGLASSSNINPVRMELTPAKRNSVVQISNADEDAVTIQASVLRWTADGEKSPYSPVDDILLNPPVFSIPAHSTQVLRLGLRTSIGTPDEQAYRLIDLRVPTVFCNDLVTKYSTELSHEEIATYPCTVLLDLLRTGSTLLDYQPQDKYRRRDRLAHD